MLQADFILTWPIKKPTCFAASLQVDAYISVKMLAARIHSTQYTLVHFVTYSHTILHAKSDISTFHIILRISIHVYMVTDSRLRMQLIP